MNKIDNGSMKKAQATIKEFRAGQIIFEQGQDWSEAYMIKTGAVEIFKIVGNQKVVLASLRPGEIFGEMALIEQVRRTACAEAVEDTELFVLSERLLDALLHQCPPTVRHMTRLLVSRLRDMGRFVSEAQARNPFISVCRLVEFRSRLLVSETLSRRAKPVEAENGVDYTDLCNFIRDVILISQVELDSIMDKLEQFKLVRFNEGSDGVGPRALRKRYVRVNEPRQFIKKAKKAHEELVEAGWSPVSEMVWIDIHEVSEMLDTTPEVIYKRMGRGEIPESLIGFHRAKTLDFLEEMGGTFFKASGGKARRPGALASVDDINKVEPKLLKTAFKDMGFFTLTVLYINAGESARELMESAMPKKVASLVRTESRRLEPSQKDLVDALDELSVHLDRGEGGKVRLKRK